MSYESIVITKHATNVWFAKDNTLPGGVAGHFVSGWNGGVNNTLFTLKSKNGGIVYNNQPWNIFSYVDNLDSGNNFTPTSAVDLVVKLTQRDFFEYSSSGGGGVDTFLQLLDVLFPNYVGRGGQVIRVNSGETGLESVTPSFAFQNNIGKAQNFTKSGSMWVNNIGMANYVNDNVTINVTETNTPVVLRVQNTTDGVTTQYLYFFFAGKGTWGEGGTATTQSQFYYITERRLTPTDVEDVPNSEIFPLGDTTGLNFWDVANLQDPPYDLNDSGELDENGNPRTYYFSFTDTGVLKFAQFIGTPGYYGVGENSFVEADFVVVTDDTITPTPNLDMVTGVGNTTTNPIVINDLVNGNKVSRGPKGETYTDANGNTITDEWPDEAAPGDAIYKKPIKTGEQIYSMLSDLWFIDPNRFEGTDTEKIQAAIAFAATGNIKNVAIGYNAAEENRLWMLDEAILLPSNINVYIINATLKLSDTCRDNAFRTSNCGYGITNPKADPRENISIIGIGDAVLEGAAHPRSTAGQKTLANPAPPESGTSYGTDAGVVGQEQVGDWRNNMLILAYTTNFLIKGITVKDPHCFCICLERCSFGMVEDIILDGQGRRIIDSVENQILNIDGVKIIQGGNNITFRNIKGHTDDNCVTAALLGEGYSTNAPGTYESNAVCGQIYDPETDDIYNITWDNLHLWSYNSIGRFLNTNGSELYNFNVTNVYDASPDDLEREIVGGVLLFGSFSSVYGGLTPLGSCRNFNISNIVSTNARHCIHMQGSLAESTITNVTKLKDNAFDAIYTHPSSTGWRNVQVTNIYDRGQRVLISGILNGVSNPYTGTREIITPSGVSRRQLVLRGTSGTANINIDGTDYTATFTTNLSATGTAFISTNGATILANEAVTVTGNNILTFEHATTGFPDITITNLTGNLNGNFGDVYPITSTYSEFVDANGKGMKCPAGNTYAPDDETMMQKKDIVALISAEAAKNKVLIADTVDGTDVTGTLTQTITKSYLIPANTTAVGTMTIEALFHKTGTTGSVLYHVYTNTTNSLSGATLIAGSGTVAASNRTCVISRKCYIKAGGTFTVFPSSMGASVPTVGGAVPSSITFDPTVNNYIIFTVTLSDITDAAKITGCEIVSRKQ